MKKTNKILLILVIIALANLSLAGERFLPTGIATHLDVAQMGMGGITVTIRNSAHAVFYNPALLNRQGLKIDISPIHGGLDNDAIEVINFIDDHEEDFDDFELLDHDEQNQFLIDSQRFDNKWVSAIITPYAGICINNIGAGMYSIIQADVKVDHGVFIPAIGMRGFQDNVYGFGIGLPMNFMGQSLDMGLSLRFIERKKFIPLRVGAADADELDQVFETAFDEFESTERGFGLDVGLIHEFYADSIGKQKGIDFALVIQDLIAELDGYVKPNVKAGIMTELPSSMLPFSCDIGIEINDLFNRQGVGFTQRLNIGGEARFLKGLLKFRGGFHQGYPTWGVGAKVLFAHADYAFFARELGTRSGQFSEATHRIQIGFSI
ncbi:MAG: hypothetical protein GY839_04430 [candidate division Zixibacteria bacterium]|nr:hypothetical protein [candidate division Zixibacteria bacterium]